MAAHEAKLGHGKLAEELRALIDEAKRRRGAGQPVPISRPRGELANLLAVSYPKLRLGEMILDDKLAQLKNIKTHKNQEIKKENTRVRRNEPNIELFSLEGLYGRPGKPLGSGDIR